ncbi:MAG: hypothetical protein M0R80_18520 [Proteobacteria bacterium]|jgi:hypothetical protein|nr:hypothetical protein [Pseudomonadota bacterium]
MSRLCKIETRTPEEMMIASAKNVAGMMALVVIALMIGIFFIGRIAIALDQKIDNQSVMLCESAKVSGNELWSDRCEGYYLTGDAKYLRQY